MSYPILYPSSEKEFLNNGIGILTDAVSVIVSEARNGEFEISVKYPINGIHFKEIKLRRILYSKPNPYDDRQAFRIYDISKPMRGTITVKAQHISYDLNGIAVSPFTAVGASAALSGLKENAVGECPFSFDTDIENEVKFSVEEPSSIRSNLGGREGSVLDIARGEYEFDNFHVFLHNERGRNRGVSIRYGKNLTDLQQDENCASVYTHVYPFCRGAFGELVTIHEKVVSVPGTFDFERMLPKDMTEYFDGETPTEAALRSKTEEYIQSSGIGVPKVSIDLSFEALEKYEESAIFEEVRLCDTVNVEFPELGVSATAKAVKVVYNAILERIDHIYVGSVRSSLVDKIIAQDKEIEKKPNQSQIKNELGNLTADILGASGGNVRMIDTNGDGMPDTLYIADHEDPDLAVKVWRFNYEGWGASENGYDGPFKMGASLDSGFIADFITAGTLKAITIEACELYGSKIHASKDGGYTTMDDSGLTVYNKNGEEIARIGYPTEEGENPYVLLGNEGKSTNVGLVKRFTNGIWVGTSAVKNITGALNKDETNRNGVSGIFINTIEGRTYIVEGKEWRNLYTGEAVARFA